MIEVYERFLGILQAHQLRRLTLHFIKYMINTANNQLQYNFHYIVYRMEFDTTSWSCPWNSDQNCTHVSAQGW